MNAPWNHAWGGSCAEDRIWAQVAGLAPSLVERRFFMVVRHFQGFLDDSFKDGLFVLGGHLAPVESWAQFSKEWEALLPYGVRRPDGRFHFRMTEMAMNGERMSRVPAFYRILERYTALSVSCSIDLEDVQRAKKRIFILDKRIDWSWVDNLYLLTWRFFMDTFHACRGDINKVISLDDRVDFYFDLQTEKTNILAAWDAYMNSRPANTAGLYGHVPRFEDDTEFLPLQSADLWAWWTRKWMAEGDFDEKFGNLDFGVWRSNDPRRHQRWHFHIPEDEIAKNLRQLLQQQVPPGVLVYDTKYRGDGDA